MPYVPAKDQDEVLQQIAHLIDAIRALDIRLPTKNRMLVHALWEVALMTGGFYPRFRSLTCTEKINQPIQRDHIFQKKKIIQRLLHEPSYLSLDAVMNAQCCVVTRPEHEALHRIDSDIDGFERYRAANIEYRDMQL